VVQTMIAAKGSDGRPFIERFHGFRNGVGNTVGRVNVSISPENIGGSKLDPTLTEKPSWDTEEVDTVHLEDLLYNMPEGERPQIRVGHKDANGNWVYAMEPLQPKHIYVIKTSVEGYDVAALHSLRRLFEGGVDERPVGFVSMFYPHAVAHEANCDVAETVRYFYNQNYTYEGYDDVDELVRGVRASAQSESGPAFEGWWDLVGYKPLHHDHVITSSENELVLDTIGLELSLNVFCNVAPNQVPPNRPASKFMEVSSVELRETAVKAIVEGSLRICRHRRSATGPTTASPQIHKSASPYAHTIRAWTPSFPG
jgi:hypothetical protein